MTTTTDMSIQDRYPTRLPEPAEWIARLDPTVWPGVTEGPATPQELAAHTERGFHTVPGLLSPQEVEHYRDALERLAADEAVRAEERAVCEPGTQALRSLFEVHRPGRLLAELATDPRLVDRARQILGSEVYVHQSRINLMPGFRGSGFYWHSDFETWHAEDGLPAPRAVSCSITLTDNHPFNGALMLLPGAHTTFVPCVGETPQRNYQSSLQAQRVGVPSEDDITALAQRHGITQFTDPAGSALFFDANSMHASGNNITPFPRSNIFLVFNSVENAPTAPFAADEPRPAFLAAREATPPA